MLTVFGEGSVAGGVYRPVAEIVPVAAAPPLTPFTSHVTAVLVLLVTVAVNCVVPPSRVWLAPLTAIWGVAPEPEPAVPLEQPAT
jgi:hypothetical protein